MSQARTKDVTFRYTHEFDPETGEPREENDGGVYVDVGPNETHEDAVFKACATRLANAPFTGDEQVVSITVSLDTNSKYRRYEFTDAASHSVDELRQRPAIVRGNLADAYDGTPARQITD